MSRSNVRATVVETGTPAPVGVTEATVGGPIVENVSVAAVRAALPARSS